MRAQRSFVDDATLLVGRGGSGTRLLSSLAADAGVFLGRRLNRQGDSTEWTDVIYRMVREAGAGHDLPTGSLYQRELRRTAEGVLAGVDDRPCAWGIKLPEAMLVLPLLVDAFPRARVVHLTRHPVSSSLRRTHKTSRLGNRLGDVTLPAAYVYSGRDVGRIATDEAFLHNAYSWTYQTSRVLDYARGSLPAPQYLELRYEDVCRDPNGALETLCAFLGCPERRAHASVEVDLLRTGTWDPRDARARAVWHICRETAERLGYHEEPPA